MLINQILPFFANTPLEKITDKDVNSWLLGFRERKVQMYCKAKGFLMTVYRETVKN